MTLGIAGNCDGAEAKLERRQKSGEKRKFWEKEEIEDGNSVRETTKNARQKATKKGKDNLLLQQLVARRIQTLPLAFLC